MMQREHAFADPARLAILEERERSSDSGRCSFGRGIGSVPSGLAGVSAAHSRIRRIWLV